MKRKKPVVAKEEVFDYYKIDLPEEENKNTSMQKT